MLRQVRWAIIGCVIWALMGCSAVRLAYDQGPLLTRWWLDDHFDFNNAQKPQVHEGVDAWFAWHRSSQLREYAQWLRRAQQEVMEPVTPDQLCRYAQEVLVRYDLAVERALPLAAGLVSTLEERQLVHLEEHYAKRNVRWRKQFLQPASKQRAENSTERAVDRAQSLYGDLDVAQKRLLAEGFKAQPFDAEVWWAQRQAQQREVVAALRQLRAEGADRERALPVLRALKARWIPVWREGSQAVEQRMLVNQCELVARLHNTTSSAQRQHARDKLRGWELDLRHLADRAVPSKESRP